MIIDKKAEGEGGKEAMERKQEEIKKSIYWVTQQQQPKK